MFGTSTLFLVTIVFLTILAPQTSQGRNAKKSLQKPELRLAQTNGLEFEDNDSRERVDGTPFAQISQFCSKGCNQPDKPTRWVMPTISDVPVYRATE